MTVSSAGLLFIARFEGYDRRAAELLFVVCDAGGVLISYAVLYQ